MERWATGKYIYCQVKQWIHSICSISCFYLAVCRCHHHPLKLHCPFLPHYSSNPPIFSIQIQRFQLPISSSISALLPSLSTNMGLSPYSNPSDAGVLCVILVKTAMSISFMKEILRSILHVVGIRFPSSEDFSDQIFTESPECRGTPSTTYMEEFRSRTPTLRYDSLSCLTKQECSVCLIEFKPEAAINRLSCGHVFHKSCLEKWLNYWNVTCPLCRNHMMAPLETEENTCPM